MDRNDADLGTPPGIVPVALAVKQAFEATVCDPESGLARLAQALGLPTDDAAALAAADWRQAGQRAATAAAADPALLWFPVLFARLAFVDPEALIPVLDDLCDGWRAAREASRRFSVLSTCSAALVTSVATVNSSARIWAWDC